MLTLLAFIFVLGIAILFHEFGHFITAKLSGIKVFRFSLGFGPRIAGIFWKGTEYVICLFPFGGYVKMAGETPQKEKTINNELSQQEEEVPDSQRYDRKSILTRIRVVVNGPIMNIILAVLLLVIVFYFSGTTRVTNTISEVAENTPAAEAEIKSGDRIIAINAVNIDNAEEISEMINQNRDQVIFLSLMRDNEVIEIRLVPEYNDEYQRAMIGITLEVNKEKLTFFQSVNKSIGMTGEILLLIAKGFLEMFTGNMPVELAGPLGIAQMAGEAAQIGFLNLLFFTAVINIFLGVINLFPIPILDGGQIVLLAIEKIRGKPLEPEHVNFLYFIGIALVVMIFLIATYQDILRFFTE